MATYNRAHLLKETLTHIQRQDYPEWECVIVDDGSVDNTAAVAESMAQGDKRFRYVRRPDYHKPGLSGCRNYGISVSKGELIQFFDDDDVMHPAMIHEKQRFLAENRDFDFVLCQFESFFGDFETESLRSRLSKGERRPLDHDLLTAYILGKVVINSVGPMWRKQIFKRRVFDEDLHYSEEWSLYAMLFADGIVGYELDDVLFFYRKHANSNTGDQHPRGRNKRHEDIRAKEGVLEYLLAKDRLNPELSRFFIRFAIKHNLPRMIQRSLESKIPTSQTRLKMFFQSWLTFIVYRITGRGLGMMTG